MTNSILKDFFLNLKSENDILLREELDQLKENYSTKFDVWYTIDKSVLPGVYIN